MSEQIDVRRLKTSATYTDVNKNFGGDGLADILYDKQAISQALFNLFGTTPGEAGPIFNPEFGSLLPLLLQEPMDSITLSKVRVATIQAVQRWEPRVEIDFSNTRIDADPNTQSYLVVLAYKIRYTGELAASRLRLTAVPEDSIASSLDYSFALHLHGWPGIYEFCIPIGVNLTFTGESAGSSASWSDIGSWESFVSWGSGTESFRYTTLFDRKIERARRVVIDVKGKNGPAPAVQEISTSSDGVTFSDFTVIDPSLKYSGRYYKLRLSISNPTTTPYLNFGVVFFYL